MKKNLEKELETHCELYWWNFGKKTLSFKGSLRGLLESQNITFSKKKTETVGIFTFTFKSESGISFKTTAPLSDFAYLAKQFIQMELVRMGDKSRLFVDCFGRNTVTVNF